MSTATGKRHRRRGAEPEGWDKIATPLRALQTEMRAAEVSDTHGKRKEELLWPIIRLSHARTRLFYHAYHVNQEIDRACVDYAVAKGLCDQALLSKWNKSGYEFLCCMRCVQAKDTQFGTACICRVPKSNLEAGKLVECVHCGCRGCASNDVKPALP